ncbi:hypothetical protein SJ05684_b52300 (plasmid) [Sinorhizobium sojae CCBAU 05684]|uniref:Uncharacterized protein n=1 Tax=Sinorhizobium sojae CCBAU 05684 TaxID=716928 RepID=A0A249PKE2_9HYPH|nr:hypothetical protein SJ05684_b52300 [Sinorhizobium sojae CCBAU 05684]
MAGSLPGSTPSVAYCSGKLRLRQLRRAQEGPLPRAKACSKLFPYCRTGGDPLLSESRQLELDIA